MKKTVLFVVMSCVFSILFGCLNVQKIYAEASYPRIDEYFDSTAPNTQDERGYLHFKEEVARQNGEIVIAYSEEIGQNSYKGKFFVVTTVKPVFDSKTNSYTITVYFYTVKWPGSKIGGSSSANYGYCYPDKYLYVDIYNGDVINYIENSSHVDGDLVASAVMDDHRIDNNSDAGNRIFIQGVYRIDSVTISGLEAGNYVLRLWDNDEVSSSKMNCGGVLGYHELSLTPEMPEYSLQYDYQGGELLEGKSNPIGYSKDSEDITINNPEKKNHTLVGWNEIIQTTDWLKGMITKSTGRAAPSTSYKNALYSEYLRVDEGVTYELKNIGDLSVDVHFYDMDMNVVEKEYFNSSTKMSFTPTSSRYIRFCYVNGHSEDYPVALQLSASLGSEVIIKKGSTGNRKYIAKWEKGNYVATFDANGGTNLSFDTIEHSFGESLGVLPTTTYDGYKFVGWYSAKEDGIQIKEDTIPLEDVTYYAHWIAIAPEITARKNTYYQNSVVTVSMIKENADAFDCVEKDISSEIVIYKAIYPSGEVVDYPKSFDTSILGEIQIEYMVCNKRGVMVSCINSIVIVPQEESVISKVKVYSRFVDDMELDDGSNALESLPENSIWRKDVYKVKLENALENMVPLQEYEYVNIK